MPAISWNTIYKYYQSLRMHPDGDFYSCGIRLSMALNHVGYFNKSAYRKSSKKVSKNGWAMVAEELYQWLRQRELGEFKQLKISAEDWSSLPQQNGIVYLRDCFQRQGESVTQRTGDHIDLFVSGEGMLSAIRWPDEFPNGPMGLMAGSKDGKARFWPIS